MNATQQFIEDLTAIARKANESPVKRWNSQEVHDAAKRYADADGREGWEARALISFVADAFVMAATRPGVVEWLVAFGEALARANEPKLLYVNALNTFQK